MSLSVDTISKLHICIVGYGVAGQLHHRLFAEIGLTARLVDLVAADPSGGPPTYTQITDVPDTSPIDLWSVCTPTDNHLATVKQILNREPRARIVIEKPLCRPSEISEIVKLMANYNESRIVVMNQYSYAKLPALLMAMLRNTDQPLVNVKVAFSKDRREDVAAGRFVDSDYGVFGYEWLHMLAILGQILPPHIYRLYLDAAATGNELQLATDPKLLVTAALQHVRLDGGCIVELFSTIVGNASQLQVPTPPWTANFGYSAGSRQRLCQVEIGGQERFTIEFDTIMLRNGSMLRNRHRLIAELPSGKYEWIIYDSPMKKALQQALRALFDDSNHIHIDLDLAPLILISRLASFAGA